MENSGIFFYLLDVLTFRFNSYIVEYLCFGYMFKVQAKVRSQDLLRFYDLRYIYCTTLTCLLDLKYSVVTPSLTLAFKPALYVVFV